MPFPEVGRDPTFFRGVVPEIFWNKMNQKDFICTEGK